MLTRETDQLWDELYDKLVELNLIESDLCELLVKLGMPEPKMDVEFNVDVSIQMRVEVSDLPRMYDESDVVDGIRASIGGAIASAFGCFRIDVHDATYDGYVWDINVDVDDVSLS